MRRIDGLLSRTAQRLDPTATVCEQDGEYLLYYADKPAVALGATFKRARGALFALVNAHRARTNDAGDDTTDEGDNP